MGTRLAGTVLLTDPETHQTVTLEAGTIPEMRLAVLVTNPVAWEGGRVPAAVKRAAAGDTTEGTEGGKDPSGDQPPAGTSPEPAAGSEDSGPEGDPLEPTLPEAEPETTPEPEPEAAPVAKKPAARKTAAKKTAAAEGTGGQ